MDVERAVNSSPRGCYLYRPTHSAAPKAYFNDGSKKVEKCSEERGCVCQCSPAVDVAFYVDEGGSHRGVHNIRQVLNYDEGIRVYNFTGKDVQTKLTKANGFDVVFFPGGAGGEERRTIGTLGARMIKSFLADGGGYCGICAGAYLGLSMGLVPFKNIPKPHEPDGRGRGDGNVTLSLTDEGLKTLGEEFGVDNAKLQKQLIFYGGGPVMVPNGNDHNGTLTNPQVLARFTSNVPIEINFNKKGLCSKPYDSPKACSGIGDAAVVSAVYKGKGVAVVIGPHPETDDLDFPHRHGPADRPGTVSGALLQSFAKYAAKSQP